ncbi:MAG: PhnD/SsuA/transferrin family substrate-binding protein [Chromatiales bacterium]|nr:PhnD/SsuA/transferrin family substrate-binding protein [Chromatiales bacterium]
MPSSLRRHRAALRAPALLPLILLLAIASGPLPAAGEPVRLAIQPIQTAETTAEFYRPLIEYLRTQTGLPIELATTSNFLTYWTQMKRGDYDLVLDAAHFTDYRIRELGYVPLAKMPGEVSYSLVTHPDTFIFEPAELTGKPVASLASPSLGMVRMLDLFPNPLRQPRILEAATTEAIIEMIESGKAVAGIIPTPLLNTYTQFNVVLTTEPAPHVTFSASPRLPAEARSSLQRALLEAGNTAEGQAMLAAIGFTALERPEATVYSGYAELLEGVWGY